MARVIPLLLLTTFVPALGFADRSQPVSLDLRQHGVGGYYLQGVFGGSVHSELLVDTGSSYVVLSGKTFQRLEREGVTAYKRTINGSTAAGRVVKARVFSIASLELGEGCVLRDIEAVALPNADRDILGLSALRRLQSFSLQFEPAALTFSNC